MKTKVIIPVFVTSIPADLEEGYLYISMDYATALHKCACGCGIEVVTPLTPTDWKLTFDGSVSLYPSIGNWSFPCRSHYWIRNSRIRWAEAWTDDEVRLNREADIARKQRHYANTKAAETVTKSPGATDSVWRRIVRWFQR